jgi:hypothetical protein
MGRFEHLSGVKRMKVGIIVPETVRRLFQNARNCQKVSGVLAVGFKGWQSAEFRLKHFRGAGKETGNWILEHGDLSQYHGLGCGFKSRLILRFRKEESRNGTK